MERVERGVDAEVDANTLGELVKSANEGKTFWTPPAASNLPEEPAAPQSEADGKRVMQELRAFHVHGRRPADDGAGTEPLPALLHPWRDMTRVRHEFPLLLDGDGATRPLSALIDELVTAASGDGDAAEQTRHTLLRVESIMRSLVNGDGDHLSLVWDRAVATLAETSRLSDEKAAMARGILARARKAIEADGELIPCGPDAAARIFSHTASASWTDRCAGFREELDALVRAMDNILAADFGHSDAAMQPEHLRETLGAEDDMDVQAMSSLLRGAPHVSGIPEQRRQRVTDTIARLKSMQPVFAADVKSRKRAPVHPDAIFTDVKEALAEYARRMEAMTAFFKSIRIARLEIQNQYRDAVHDDYFATFDPRHLTAEEMELFPPVLVRTDGNALAEGGAGELLGALEASARIKVMVELRDLYHITHKTITGAWPLRLAGVAMNLQNAYVLQAPVSRATLLHERLRDGMRFAGAALFCVAVPLTLTEGAAVYLAAAAATESRMAPVLVFDPSRGETLAERIDISGNTQLERMWPVESFQYRSSAGEEITTEAAFTPADFMFCDPLLNAHFWIVPRAQWHDAMLPLHQTLELSVNEAAGRIPYILVVDRDNRVGRAAVSRSVLELSRRCRGWWRGLRESGGVGNSFAARALEDERAKLATEKEREIEEIEKNYVSQLEQDVGELTREIVQRIAAQLMGANGSAAVSIPMPVSSPAPAPKVEKAAPEVPATPAADDDVVVVVTDAYIDTPLCTSCNECTQLNSRIFAYNGNKQAEVKDAGAGPFSDIVRAAELCPVHIIHPGKPKNPSEPGLDEWVKRAERYN